MPSIVALAERLPILGPRRGRAFTAHVIASVAFTTLHVLIASTCRFAMQRALQMPVAWGPLVADLFERDRAVCDLLRQILPFDQFHDDGRDTGGLFQAMDAADVRMIQ